MTTTPAPEPAHDHHPDRDRAPDDERSRHLARPSPAGFTPWWLNARSPAPRDLAAAEVAALAWLDPDFEPWPDEPCPDEPGPDEPGPDEPGPDDERPASAEVPLEQDRYGTIILDPCDSPVERWEAMPRAQRHELLGVDDYPDGSDAEDPDQDAFPELIEAGFMHRYPIPGATGFRAGGPLDTMLPGGDLAWHVGAARQRGLGELSDDELIGVLAAARRGEAWQAAMVLAATAELDARRAGPDGREGEHVEDELAAALTLTPRAAQAQ